MHVIGNKDQVPLREVPIEGSKEAYIQWLIDKDKGSSRYAVRRFLIRPSGRIALHLHDYEEAVYILRGSCTVCSGDERIRMKQGDYIYISGGEPHAFINDGYEELEFLCVIPYVKDMTIKTVEGDC